LRNSGKDLYNPAFSHIYIEKGILNHPETVKILSRFPGAGIIVINHYKDVFSRSGQNFLMQKQSPSLILAKKQDNFLYKGAPVCQDFGHNHFYHTPLVMNCIYDCEYCYLQGMYSSANMVVFVNLEDYFMHVEKMLQNHPVYLCISYDTDLLALEHKLGYVRYWNSFAESHPNLTIEVRTKSAGFKSIEKLTPLENFILAWTLSPETVQKNFEHKTPSLTQRISCIKKALDRGFKVRLCFDPLIYSKDWYLHFSETVEKTFSEIPAGKIHDVGMGVFRISRDYLKRMRKNRPDSVITQYPYEYDNGVYHYGKELTDRMVSEACDILSKHVPAEKIYIWKEAEGERNI
jgi:spore photoproduct lyase